EARANIVVDINNYRNARTDKLERLAQRMADQVAETKRMVTMEPMPPHERRIIHMVLRKREDVETESKGQGNERRVTILPKRDPIR
ncbi:MAG: R3H domain-containing nucleic acid-binding protein, partial [Chloroflexota bacterium]